RLVSSSAAAVRTIQGDEERREWQAHTGRPWNEEGAVAKITLLPGDLAATLDAIENAAAGAPYEVVGRAGLGVLMVRLGGDVALQSRAISALRARVPLDKGSVTVLRGDSAIKAESPVSDAERVMQAVKRAFDPAGVL